jgi:hypothetical protein
VNRACQCQDRLIHRICGGISGETERLIIVKNKPTGGRERVKFPFPHEIHSTLTNHREFNLISENTGVFPLEPTMSPKGKILSHRGEIPAMREKLPQSVQIPISQTIRIYEDCLIIRCELRESQFVQEGLERVINQNDVIELRSDVILLVANDRERHRMPGEQMIRSQEIPGNLVIVAIPRRNGNEPPHRR